MCKRSTVMLLVWLLVPAGLTGTRRSTAGTEEQKSPAAGAALEKRSWDILTGACADEKPLRRMHALSALAAIGSTPRVVQLLERALDDPDSAVRQVAASTLGEIRSRASIPKLRKLLQEDRHPEVIFTAAKALWDVGDREVREIFHEVLAGERSDTHPGIGGAMHDVKSKLRNRNAAGWALMGIKEAAGYVLGPFSLGIALAEEIGKDASASARALSATLLATDPDPSSQQALEWALTDKNWIVRTAAAKSLARRGSASAVPKLEPLLGEERDAVRYMAAAAIVRLAAKRM